MSEENINQQQEQQNDDSERRTESVLKLNSEEGADNDDAHDSEKLANAKSNVPHKTKRRLSTNLLLDDTLRTVSVKERSLFKTIRYSERKYDTFLSSRNIVRCGIATLAYYQVFDHILSRQICTDYKQLGALLKNSPYIKSVINATLASIPKRDGLTNRGYLKSHMSLSRGFIQADLEEIISNSFIISDRDRGDNVGSSLSWILQTILMYEFAQHKLIDYSELAVANMAVIDEYCVDFSDYESFRDYVLAEQVHEGIVRLSKISSSITATLSKVYDNDRDRGVDFAIITRETMKIIDEIADFLLILEQRKTHFDTLLMLCRIIRDREFLLRYNTFREIADAVDSFYTSNKEAVDIIIGNYDFNCWMDEISEEEIFTSFRTIINLVVGHATSYSDLLRHIMFVLNNPLSIVRKVSAEEFVDEFNILIKKDNATDRAIHTFLSRKIGQINPYELFEMLIQTEKPFQRITTKLDKDAFILIMGKFFNGNDYRILIESIAAKLVKAQELSFASVVDAYLPRYIDKTVHQYTQLLRGDLNKLACIKADRTVKYYEALYPYTVVHSEAERGVSPINNDIVIKKLCHNCIDEKQKVSELRKYEHCHIFIKKLERKGASHGDIIEDVSMERTIVTREARRIIEDGESSIGKTYYNLNADLINKAQAYGTKEFMSDEFTKRLSLINTRKEYRVRIPKPFLGIGTDVSLVVNTEKLWTPISTKNWLTMPVNPYGMICEDYCHALEIFKMHIIELSRTMDLVNINDDQSNELMSEYDPQVVNVYREQARLLNDKIWHVGNWLVEAGITTDLANQLIDNSMVFESGDFLHIKQPNIIQFTVNFPKFVRVREAITERLKHLGQLRNFNYACTFQARFFSMLDRLYKEDQLFNSMVDGANIATLDMEDINYREYVAMLKVFENPNNQFNSALRVLNLSVASIIAAILYTPSIIGGFSERVLGDTNENLIKYQNMFVSRITAQFNAWGYAKYNRSTISEDLKLIDELDEEVIFGFFHSEYKSKDYQYEAFDISRADANMTSAHSLGSYNIQPAKGRIKGESR